MAFRSQHSGKEYPAGTKPVRIVVATRQKTYVGYEGKRSNGWEIVKEIDVGPDEVQEVQEKYPAAKIASEIKGAA